MAVLKLAALDSFLHRPDKGIAAVLVYGSDPGKVHEVARRIVTRIAGSHDDPFRVSEIDDQSLAQRPGLLGDELSSASLLGGARVTVIANAGQGLAAAFELLDWSTAGSNMIVAEAGSLPRSSRLRSLFETSRHAYVIACYEDTARDLSELIAEAEKRTGIAVVPDARSRLLSMLGDDRVLTRMEIDKLFLYGHGRSELTLADVEAIVSDKWISGLDAICDTAFCGEIAATDLLLGRYFESGEGGTRFLSAVANHVAMLQRLIIDVENGASPQAVAKNARPPIFFGRQQRIVDQLRIWDAASLSRAAESAARAVLHTREFPALENQIAARTLLSLANIAAGHLSRAA